MDKNKSEEHYISEQDRNLQFSLNIVYLFAGIVHFIFLLLFYKLGIKEMQVANYFSPWLYLLAFYLNRRGKIILAATIGVSEVVIHGILSLFYIGWETNFHIYIVFVYFLIFFFYRIKISMRIVYAILITICFALTYYYAIKIGSKYHLPDNYIIIAGISNICFAACVLSIFAVTYSHFIQNNIQLLRSAEKQQRELNDQKNKFFSIFSHDLKNPVTTLNGFVNLMLDKYDRIDDEKKKQFMLQIQQSVNDLHKLVIGLLEWSQSQMENIRVLPVKINVNQIFKEIKNLYEHYAIQKNIKIQVQAEENIFINVDEQMFRSILRNLLSNAVKFTSKDGIVEMTCFKTEQSVIILVKDNGIGIPEDVMKNLFKLNRNTQRLGTEKETGAGLGLIVAKEFTEKNNGILRIKSLPLKGTTVYLDFPVN